MASQKLISYVNQIDAYASKNPHIQYVENYIQALEVAMHTEKDIDFGLEISKKARKCIEKIIYNARKQTFWEFENDCIKNDWASKEVDLYYEILKEESFYRLESFIFYMEKKRPQEKRFYLPRRKTLSKVIPNLEDLVYRRIKFLGVSMPSRTGKSTLCIFALNWVMLRKPNSHSAMGGHSGILAKGFHKELSNLIETEEYSFKELYEFYHPGHLLLRNKSAEEFTLNLDAPDRFATFTARGIDGTWTGAVDVSWDGILYVDDLVRDREHSLSPQRMENTFQEYLNKMVDRKSGSMPMMATVTDCYGDVNWGIDWTNTFAGSCELMVGTLWNVLDPLERMSNLYADDPLYRFLRIPALDENDESNFAYDLNGFTTEYYRDMRERLDDAEWMAKYMQKPYLREGLLMPNDELRYFNGILPDGDSRVVAVVDVAWGGGDSLSMPIGREYENGDVYIFAWVFSKAAKEITVPIVVGRIIENEIRQCRFEGNVGGAMYSEYVDEHLRKAGYKCSCTEKKAPNNMAKVEKIIAYSGDVKRKFVFISSKRPTAEELAEDEKLGIKRYTRDSDYQNAMNEMCSFVTIGKNPNDDAIDSITQLEMFIEGDGLPKPAKIVRGVL